MRSQGPVILRQVWLLWLCLLFTTALFIVTTLYASRPGFFSAAGYSTTTISRPVRDLRILSGVTDILLGVTFSLVLERVQWALIARKGGMRFTELLSLHASTGYLGLLKLAYGKGSMDVVARAISQVRLLVAICCAVLGVIIMSDVQNIASHRTIRTWDLVGGSGLGEFNGSLAFLSAAQIDRIFGSSQVNTFLTSNELAVDLTDGQSRDLSCDQLDYSGPVATCERTVFMPGGAPMELVMADGHPEADVLISYDMNGYVLRYGRSDIDNSWYFDEETECRTLGVETGAVRLCIKNTDKSNTLQARIVKCPTAIAFTASRCITETTWHTNTSNAISTTLTTTFQRADVSYHRSNTSIASHVFKTGEVDAPVNATDLLDAYMVFVRGSGAMLDLMVEQQTTATVSTETLSSDDTSIGVLDDLLGTLEFLERNASGDSRKRQSLDEQSFDDTDLFSGILPGTAGVQLPGSNPMFPAMPFAMLEACSFAGSENPRLAAYCTNFLQNFLAIPLYWCHRLLPIHATMGTGTMDFLSIARDGTKAEALRDFIEYLGLDDTHVKSLMKEQPDAKVAIAKLEYIIRVSQPPLIAYCVIASLIIALCLGALVMGSVVNVEYGSFALWDLVNRVETHLRYKGQLNDTGTVAADLEACGNKRSDFEGSTSQIRPDARHAEHIQVV